MPLKNEMVVALDGPAASGKGTLARRIADHFNLALLDTGALYRAVGWKVLQSGGDPDNENDALKAVQKLSDIDLSNPDLKTESIGAAASKVASKPSVRRSLVDFQRNFAHNPPADKNGTILDGRDIGTVICPEAKFKIFVTADIETRAKRRFLEEFGSEGSPENYQNILNDLMARDERDMNRTTSPLKQAANAHLIDTTEKDIEAVFDAAVAYVSSKQLE